LEEFRGGGFGVDFEGGFGPGIATLP